MDSIFILIPIALLFTGLAIRAFFWAVDNKQYDDLDAAGQSILFDEDAASPSRVDKGLSQKTNPNSDQVVTGQAESEPAEKAGRKGKAN